MMKLYWIALAFMLGMILGMKIDDWVSDYFKDKCAESNNIYTCHLEMVPGPAQVTKGE